MSLLLYVVSIHAPVKGATYTLGTIDIDFSVSIHAPVKGATAELSITTRNRAIKYATASTPLPANLAIGKKKSPYATQSAREPPAI